MCVQYKKQLPAVPANTTKAAYGKVTLNPVATVTQLLNVLSPDPPLTSLYPLNMEQSGHVRLLLVINVKKT